MSRNTFFCFLMREWTYVLRLFLKPDRSVHTEKLLNPNNTIHWVSVSFYCMVALFGYPCPLPSASYYPYQND